MFCKNCGKNIEGSPAFCPYCGTATAPAAPATPDIPITPAAPATPVAPITEAAPIAPQKKPKKKGKAIAIAVIALILVGAIAAGAVMLKITSDPLYRLSKAFENLSEYDSMDISADIYADGDGVGVDLSYSKSAQAFLAEVDMPSFYQYNLTLGMLNNRLVVSADIPDSTLPTSFYVDFEEGTFGDEINLEKLISSIEKSIASDEFNPNDYIKNFVKTDKIPGVIESLMNTLGENFKNEEWLVDVMGYEAEQSGKETTITLRPDIMDLYELAFEELSPAFTAEIKSTMREEEDYLSDDLEYSDCEIVITLNGTDLQSIDFELNYDGDNLLSVELNIENINSAKVDTEAIKELDEDSVSLYECVIAPMYKAVTENAITKTCLGNQREIVAQFNNHSMIGDITLSDGDKYIIKTNSDGTAGKWTCKKGSEKASTIASMFQIQPYCPYEDGEIIVTIEDGYVETYCSKHTFDDSY